MAWATKCDRCGKYFDYNSDSSDAVALMTYDRSKDRYMVEEEEYDLCPDCVKSWISWFNEKRR